METKSSKPGQKTHVLILAGGNSERMGFPKPFLPAGEKTLIETIVSIYERYFSEIFVVLNAGFSTGKWSTYANRLAEKTTLILNPDPERGKFYSLQLGLSQMQDADYCFIQPTDNPVNAETIGLIADHKNPDGYTVPSFEVRTGHPILISSPIMEDIRKAPDSDQHLAEFLRGYNRRIVETADPFVLINLNTATDFARFIASSHANVYS